MGIPPTTAALHLSNFTAMATNADPRGVLRGACSNCSCDGYQRPDSGFKCDGCGHPPAKHENRSAPQLAAAAPSRPAPNVPPGPACTWPGCAESQFFDLNTGIQSAYCKDHQQSVTSSDLQSSLTQSLGSMSLDSAQPWSYSLEHSFPASLPTATATDASMDQTLSMPSLSPQLTYQPASLLSLPPQSLPPPPSQVPAPTTPLSLRTSPLHPSASSPALIRQPSMPTVPSVPPDQQCKLPGCQRPRYKEPNGKVHDYCGRRHALEFARLNEQGVLSPDQKCKTMGCNRRRWAMPDGQGFYDFCSITCRDSGYKSPSDMDPSSKCLIKDCNRPKYVDPANNRTHDYCGRTHAQLGRSLGIKGDATSPCQIQQATGQELSNATLHFTSHWAKAKGKCPPITCVFVVTNTTLQQRFSQYQQTLSVTTVEQHYHGTKLACNIAQQNVLCSDSECGVCGICLNGLDRRCIRKRINFQRYGHGFYFAPNSSKCHDYTQGDPRYMFRAMLLFDIAPGKKYKMQTNSQDLKAPPKGYDSVYGVGSPGSVLNYDELVVYNPDSALPHYIVVYKKDGVNPIAR